jgi:hypothetical protein
MVFVIWRRRLAAVLAFYETKRIQVRGFWPKLFGLFVLLNIACYWLALLTAFSERLERHNAMRYVLMEFPVGFLGALFDVFSLVVTVLIVRRALRTVSELSYLAHLSVDLGIAVLATCWVLIVFSVSGWIVDRLAPELAEQRRMVAVAPSETGRTAPALAPAPEPAPGSSMTTAAPPGPAITTSLLTGRGRFYGQRLIDAITDPFAPDNLRNIFFGLLIGASAMLPTLLHVVLSLTSIMSTLSWRRQATG